MAGLYELVESLVMAVQRIPSKSIDDPAGGAMEAFFGVSRKPKLHMELPDMDMHRVSGEDASATASNHHHAKQMPEQHEAACMWRVLLKS